MKKLLFLGVAALVLSACSNEVEELQSSKVEYAKTIKAEVAPFTTNDGTRTTVVLNGFFKHPRATFPLHPPTL